MSIEKRAKDLGMIDDDTTDDFLQMFKNIHDEKSQKQNDTVFGYCDDCNVPLGETPAGMVCPECSKITEIYGDIGDDGDSSVGIIKMRTPGYKNIYMSIGNNVHAKKKQIKNHLNKLNAEYQGTKVPQHIIDDVVDTYNIIQQIEVPVFDDNGKVIGHKAFVKRSSILSMLLGALLFYECLGKNFGMPERSIVKFMQIESSGISQGKTIVRDLHNAGYIQLPIHADPSNNYTRRHLTSLGLFTVAMDGNPTPESIKRKDFIDEIVERAQKHRIGCTITKNSKIVGSIWILICCMGLDISHEDITDKCIGIRKNTYMNFEKELRKSSGIFADIFEKYGFKFDIEPITNVRPKIVETATRNTRPRLKIVKVTKKTITSPFIENREIGEPQSTEPAQQSTSCCSSDVCGDDS